MTSPAGARGGGAGSADEAAGGGGRTGETGGTGGTSQGSETSQGSTGHTGAGRRQNLAVLGNAGFRRLFLAQTVNLLGSAIAPIALAFAVLGQPGGSATHLGLILAARSLGQVTFLLFGGVLADRMPRLRLMTGANLIAAAAQGSVAGLFLAGPAPLAAVAGLAAVNGAAAALFLPAARGVVPQLIPADQLLAAASVVPLLSRAVRDLPAGPAGAAPGTVGSVAG